MRPLHPRTEGSCSAYSPMYRLYTRGPLGKGYVPVGWFCPRCHSPIWDHASQP